MSHKSCTDSNKLIFLPTLSSPLAVDPSRIVVVTGSSAGFLLVFTAAFDPGDVVAIPTTCYPCYRNILGALGVGTANLPLNEEFKITAKELMEEVERRREEGEERAKTNRIQQFFLCF